MDREWNDNQPIYRQLRDRVVAMILDGVLREGDPLPSVRNVAAEYRRDCAEDITGLKHTTEATDAQQELCVVGEHSSIGRRLTVRTAGRTRRDSADISSGTRGKSPRIVNSRVPGQGSSSQG